MDITPFRALSIYHYPNTRRLINAAGLPGVGVGRRMLRVWRENFLKDFDAGVWNRLVAVGVYCEAWSIARYRMASYLCDEATIAIHKAAFLWTFYIIGGHIWGRER